MTERLITLEHPGIFLKEEFMDPFGLSAYRVAMDAKIPNMAISEILRGVRSITPRVGIRLAKYFGVSEGYFARLQLQYDIDRIKENEAEEIGQIKAIG